MRDDPWFLVEAGRFQDALRAFDKIEAEGTWSQRRLALGNKALTLLAMGLNREALAAFETLDRLLETGAQGGRELLRCAQAHWLLGDKARARSTAARNLDLVLAGNTTRTSSTWAVFDALFVFFLGAAMDDKPSLASAARYLTAISENMQAKQPNAALISCVLGSATLDSTIKVWTGSPSLNLAAGRAGEDAYIRRVLPEILFYAAAGERARGNDQRAIDLLKICTALPNPLIVMEWYLARCEHRSMFRH
jgi:tetratricopeptide (TPR) repeat protein